MAYKILQAEEQLDLQGCPDGPAFCQKDFWSTGCECRHGLSSGEWLPAAQNHAQAASSDLPWRSSPSIIHRNESAQGADEKAYTP